MAGVRERYISLKEIIQPLNNELIYEKVAEGLQERYGDSGYAARQALSALMMLGNDFPQFRRIWSADDTVQGSKKKKFFRAAVSVIANILL
jgi:hypothetical protein